MRVDADILRENVSVFDVATHFAMPFNEENGKVYSVCPAGHDSKSGKSFILEKEKFRCWSCNLAGNSISLYMEKTGMDFKEAIHSMAENLCKSAIIEDTFSLKKNTTKIFDEIQEVFTKTSDKVKKGLEDLMIERGFDKNVIEKYGIGYSTPALEDKEIDLNGTGLVKNNYYFTAKRLTIPIKSHGEIIGFTMRKLLKKEDKTPKYYNVTKKSDDQWLWNYHYKMKEIVICEGVFDAMTVQEYGYDAVATLGTAISKERIEKVLRGAKKIWLMFDADNAGSLAVERFFFNNMLTCDVFVCDLPNHDPDECSKDEIDNSIEKAVEIKEWLISKKTELNDKKKFLANCKLKLDKLTAAYMERLLVASIRKDQVEIFLERAGFLENFFDMSYDNKFIFAGTWNECNCFEYQYKKANYEIKDYTLFSRVDSTKDRLEVIEKKILSAVNNLLNNTPDRSSGVEFDSFNIGV